MNPAERSLEVKRRATALGFTLTGVTRLDRNPHAAELDAWLAAGHAGTMTYLHRQAEKRKDPRTIMPGAKAAVVTLTSYFHGWRAPGPRSGAEVAQYAWSSDYHDVLGERLEELAAAIGELIPGSTARCYVDAGPVPERELAQLAGLGWIGKNMMLINPEIGSFTFIGVVLTDAELEPDLPSEDEVRVGQHDADEGERATVGVDQHHVLPDPAEPCPLGQLPLGDGSRVDIAAGLGARSDLTNHGGQPLEPTTQHAMVVRRPGVLGDLPRGRTDPGRKPGVIGSVEVVRKRDHGDLGVWHDAGGVLALLRLPWRYVMVPA